MLAAIPGSPAHHSRSDYIDFLARISEIVVAAHRPRKLSDCIVPGHIRLVDPHTGDGVLFLLQIECRIHLHHKSGSDRSVS